MKNKSIVYNEDCNIVMKRYADNFFDLAIVDPPYGINATNFANGNQKNRPASTAVRLKKGRLNSGGGKLKNRALNTMPLAWDSETPTQEYFTELFRVSKNQIIFGANYFNLPPSICMICWDKIQPWDNFSQFELAWTSFDKPAKMYRISNRGGNNKETKIHPTQKPVALYDKIYNEFVTQGMTIIDTHLGSGSNRITAYKLDVHFVGCEIETSYFNDSEKRFLEFSKHKRVEFKEPIILNNKLIFNK